ncbi:hypothetical protein [Haloferax larsenii]|uniref:Uncharacterized protein n=1 Tax=Haloferax larsenii TaxID=302484 RepID=A0A1H7UTC9_HALLR|nr:hypothetical protein [Haloferax larsenii]SEM00084.1 hypothetical protein SAMN04488691_11424 [Haloferax larsenii]
MFSAPFTSALNAASHDLFATHSSELTDFAEVQDTHWWPVVAVKSSAAGLVLGSFCAGVVIGLAGAFRYDEAPLKSFFVGVVTAAVRYLGHLVLLGG